MLQKYEQLPPSELPTPQEYLEQEENRKYLRAFSRFYTDLGPGTVHMPKDQTSAYPTFIASLMTRAENRSALILRASEGEFHEIDYRLFTFTFAGESGIHTEYKLISDNFGIVDESFAPHPTRYMEFQFQKQTDSGDKLLLTLGENDQFPNTISTNNEPAIYIDHATNLILPTAPPISVGQHALRQVTAA
jgi:hypothetical protein